MNHLQRTLLREVELEWGQAPAQQVQNLDGSNSIPPESIGGNKDSGAVLDPPAISPPLFEDFLQPHKLAKHLSCPFVVVILTGADFRQATLLSSRLRNTAGVTPALISRIWRSPRRRGGGSPGEDHVKLIDMSLTRTRIKRERFLLLLRLPSGEATREASLSSLRQGLLPRSLDFRFHADLYEEPIEALTIAAQEVPRAFAICRYTLVFASRDAQIEAETVTEELLMAGASVHLAKVLPRKASRLFESSPHRGHSEYDLNSFGRGSNASAMSFAPSDDAMSFLGRDTHPQQSLAENLVVILFSGPRIDLDQQFWCPAPPTRQVPARGQVSFPAATAFAGALGPPLLPIAAAHGPPQEEVKGEESGPTVALLPGSLEGPLLPLLARLLRPSRPAAIAEFECERLEDECAHPELREALASFRMCEDARKERRLEMSWVSVLGPACEAGAHNAVQEILRANGFLILSSVWTFVTLDEVFSLFGFPATSSAPERALRVLVRALEDLQEGRPRKDPMGGADQRPLDMLAVDANERALAGAVSARISAALRDFWINDRGDPGLLSLLKEELEKGMDEWTDLSPSLLAVLVHLPLLPVRTFLVEREGGRALLSVPAWHFPWLSLDEEVSLCDPPLFHSVHHWLNRTGVARLPVQIQRTPESPKRVRLVRLPPSADGSGDPPAALSAVWETSARDRMATHEGRTSGGFGRISSSKKSWERALRNSSEGNPASVSTRPRLPLLAVHSHSRQHFLWHMRSWNQASVLSTDLIVCFLSHTPFGSQNNPGGRGGGRGVTPRRLRSLAATADFGARDSPRRTGTFSPSRKPSIAFTIDTTREDEEEEEERRPMYAQLTPAPLGGGEVREDGGKRKRKGAGGDGDKGKNPLLSDEALMLHRLHFNVLASAHEADVRAAFPFATPKLSSGIERLSGSVAEEGGETKKGNVQATFLLVERRSAVLFAKALETEAAEERSRGQKEAQRGTGGREGRVSAMSASSSLQAAAWDPDHLDLLKGVLGGAIVFLYGSWEAQMVLEHIFRDFMVPRNASDLDLLARVPSAEAGLHSTVARGRGAGKQNSDVTGGGRERDQDGVSVISRVPSLAEFSDAASRAGTAAAGDSVSISPAKVERRVSVVRMAVPASTEEGGVSVDGKAASVSPEEGKQRSSPLVKDPKLRRLLAKRGAKGGGGDVGLTDEVRETFRPSSPLRVLFSPSNTLAAKETTERGHRAAATGAGEISLDDAENAESVEQPVRAAPFLLRACLIAAGHYGWRSLPSSFDFSFADSIGDAWMFRPREDHDAMGGEGEDERESRKQEQTSPQSPGKAFAYAQVSASRNADIARVVRRSFWLFKRNDHSARLARAAVFLEKAEKLRRAERLRARRERSRRMKGGTSARVQNEILRRRKSLGGRSFVTFNGTEDEGASGWEVESRMGGQGDGTLQEREQRLWRRVWTHPESRGDFLLSRNFEMTSVTMQLVQSSKEHSKERHEEGEGSRIGVDSDFPHPFAFGLRPPSFSEHSVSASDVHSMSAKERIELDGGGERGLSVAAEIAVRKRCVFFHIFASQSHLFEHFERNVVLHLDPLVVVWPEHEPSQPTPTDEENNHRETPAIQQAAHTPLQRLIAPRAFPHPKVTIVTPDDKTSTESHRYPGHMSTGALSSAASSVALFPQDTDTQTASSNPMLNGRVACVTTFTSSSHQGVPLREWLPLIDHVTAAIAQGWPDRSALGLEYLRDAAGLRRGSMPFDTKSERSATGFSVRTKARSAKWMRSLGIDGDKSDYSGGSSDDAHRLAAPTAGPIFAEKEEYRTRRRRQTAEQCRMELWVLGGTVGRAALAMDGLALQTPRRNWRVIRETHQRVLLGGSEINRLERDTPLSLVQPSEIAWLGAALSEEQGDSPGATPGDSSLAGQGFRRGAETAAGAEGRRQVPREAKGVTRKWGRQLLQKMLSDVQKGLCPNASRERNTWAELDSGTRILKEEGFFRRGALRGPMRAHLMQNPRLAALIEREEDPLAWGSTLRLPAVATRLLNLATGSDPSRILDLARGLYKLTNMSRGFYATEPDQMPEFKRLQYVVSSEIFESFLRLNRETEGEEQRRVVEDLAALAEAQEKEEGAVMIGKLESMQRGPALRGERVCSLLPLTSANLRVRFNEAEQSPQLSWVDVIGSRSGPCRFAAQVRVLLSTSASLRKMQLPARVRGGDRDLNARSAGGRGEKESEETDVSVWQLLLDGFLQTFLQPDKLLRLRECTGSDESGKGRNERYAKSPAGRRKEAQANGGVTSRDAPNAVLLENLAAFHTRESGDIHAGHPARLLEAYVLPHIGPFDPSAADFSHRERVRFEERETQGLEGPSDLERLAAGYGNRLLHFEFHTLLCLLETAAVKARMDPSDPFCPSQDLLPLPDLVSLLEHQAERCALVVHGLGEADQLVNAYVLKVERAKDLRNRDRHEALAPDRIGKGAKRGNDFFQYAFTGRFEGDVPLPDDFREAQRYVQTEGRRPEPPIPSREIAPPASPAPFSPSPETLYGRKGSASELPFPLSPSPDAPPGGPASPNVGNMRLRTPRPTVGPVTMSPSKVRKTALIWSKFQRPAEDPTKAAPVTRRSIRVEKEKGERASVRFSTASPQAVSPAVSTRTPLQPPSPPSHSPQVPQLRPELRGKGLENFLDDHQAAVQTDGAPQEAAGLPGTTSPEPEQAKPRLSRMKSVQEVVEDFFNEAEPDKNDGDQDKSALERGNKQTQRLPNQRSSIRPSLANPNRPARSSVRASVRIVAPPTSHSPHPDTLSNAPSTHSHQRPSAAPPRDTIPPLEVPLPMPTSPVKGASGGAHSAYGRFCSSHSYSDNRYMDRVVVSKPAERLSTASDPWSAVGGAWGGRPQQPHHKSDAGMSFERYHTFGVSISPTGGRRQTLSSLQKWKKVQEARKKECDHRGHFFDPN
uniref:Uncharacterized protein n=1 Tax=Chromera velia CCMP2878 TaxID=1169474 RepID=A0A0G4HKH3_9ALVE|eukprot:Cvel_7210.t1-p1 / transcript=Cvel_7210.t1 / gene=Cvel_7210 / organism=Chromera_velia_CCMP2878 / gene_product=hypothetical protein / transcript_product=hypothetical protein / location=Cvel_scaffold371:50516-60860(+) / protein_length=2915 / sequence_SO=supercontig / SO=protein_coding / is_pseudo=false